MTNCEHLHDLIPLFVFSETIHQPLKNARGNQHMKFSEFVSNVLNKHEVTISQIMCQLFSLFFAGKILQTCHLGNTQSQRDAALT